MEENTLQWIAIIKLLLVVIGSGLYGYGGMSDTSKNWRRIGTAIVVGGGVIALSLWQGVFGWLLLLYPLLLWASLTIGYGADSFWMKIWKRFYYGAALAISALPIALTNHFRLLDAVEDITGIWLMFGLHCFLAIGVSIIMGVWNPKDARHEETFICACSIITPLFMV